MEQIDIDFTPRARSSDPQTSHDAAAKVDGSTLAGRVLEELRANGPGTSHDLARRMGLSLVTVSPRMKPLVLRGLVEIEGKIDGRTIWRAA